LRTSGGSERFPGFTAQDAGRRRERGQFSVRSSARSPQARTPSAGDTGTNGSPAGGPGGTAPGSRGSDGSGSGRDPLRTLIAFSEASNRILREEDLDFICRLFLEALRQHSSYRRAVLIVYAEDGRDAQIFFTGFSDEEIDHFHAHKPGPEVRAVMVEERFRIGHSYLVPARECNGAGLPPESAGDVICIPLPGSTPAYVGAVMLFGADAGVRPGPEDLAPLEQLAAQVAHAIQKKLLDQKIKAIQARLLTVQSQLLQAEKMSAIGLLVSSVAHELNNPLSGIMGFAQLLLQHELNPKSRQHLERIYNEAVRSQRIVQNLLSFSRRHKPEKTYESLSDVIDGVIELRAYQLQVDNVEVVRLYDRRLPKTMLDFHQLQQVILNVVNNAHQAMMEVGDRPRRLVITTEKRGEGLRASFGDSGTGIASDRLESIFDPFFTTKKTGKGTGLGLSVSRAIVKDHQGSMSAESVVGEGSTIHIDLPLLDPPASGAGAGGREAKAAGPTGPMRLLVVDDETILVELLVEYLRSLGHSVDDARDGMKALELATTRDYDAIVTDLKMPGLDGQGMYQSLCRIKPHMARRFIFSTGDLANPRTQAFFQSAGCPYLSKPFRLEAILSLLEQISRASRAA
jgi:signal transduction histidine kinase/ActR/RegA family two-component response regulator